MLPISTCAPDEPAVAVGVLVSLLSEPQPASARAAATTDCERPHAHGHAGTRSMRFVIPSSRPRSHTIGSPFLYNTVWSLPYTMMSLTTLSAMTMLDEPCTVTAQQVPNALIVLLVPVDDQRRLVAVDRLLEALAIDVGVAVLRLGRRDTPTPSAAGNVIAHTASDRPTLSKSRWSPLVGRAPMEVERTFARRPILAGVRTSRLRRPCWVA